MRKEIQRKMKKRFLFGALCAAALFPSAVVEGQDKFQVAGGADVVNDYVWRGMDQGFGASLQPNIALSFRGFTLGAWGSTSISDLDKQEVDLSLTYAVGGFSAGITDYWWSGKGEDYGRYEDSHYWEANVAYTFRKIPLTLAWNTMFAGADKDGGGGRYYSSYFNASYAAALPKDVVLTPSVGINPYKSQYDEGFNVMDIGLKASKDIRLAEHFSMPIFVQALYSPAKDHLFLVAGLRFALE